MPMVAHPRPLVKAPWATCKILYKLVRKSQEFLPYGTQRIAQSWAAMISALPQKWVPTQ